MHDSKLIVYQIDSFTREKFKGNPAGVVLNANGLSSEQMQLIARELNNSETAFLFRTNSPDHDGSIRYFTPLTEVPTCGHATIAAMYALAVENNLGSCIYRMKTQIGILPFEIRKVDNDYEITMTQGPFSVERTLGKNEIQQLLTILGLENADFDSRCPIQIVSTGHSKVMIGIKKRKRLNQLHPNCDGLVDLSQQIKCNGYYVFTLDSDDKYILAYGRMFAPAIGIREDPVTGNANGPLGGYLITNHIIETPNSYLEFNARQGETINRAGTIHVRVDIENSVPVCIQVRGDAVVVFRTEISAF